MTLLVLDASALVAVLTDGEGAGAAVADALVGRALALDIRLKSEMIDADDAVQHFLLTI